MKEKESLRISKWKGVMLGSGAPLLRTAGSQWMTG